MACLLHYIGTTAWNMRITRMSFEYFSAMEANHVLRIANAGVSQRESVVEAIIRVHDLGKSGTMTMLTAVLQLATFFGGWLVLSFE